MWKFTSKSINLYNKVRYPFHNETGPVRDVDVATRSQDTVQFGRLANKEIDGVYFSEIC